MSDTDTLSTTYIQREELQVNAGLINFIENEALEGLDVEVRQFWRGLSELVERNTEKNQQLLKKRDYLQQKIDSWHKEYGSVSEDPEGYCNFLQEIGYFDPDPESFSIATENLDPEFTAISGPQLVVPVSNARYALNAANARWGSLYDALYGTDVIPHDEALAPRAEYNAARGQAVFAFVAAFLDKAFPLKDASHSEVTAYELDPEEKNTRLVIDVDGKKTSLQNVDAFRGFAKEQGSVSILLSHHQLHCELVINRAHPIGNSHPAGLADVFLESATTVIQDCEDSVAAVDARDKIAVYRNWLGLMRGDLEVSFEKNGKKTIRKLNPDRKYTAVDGSEIFLKGRGLMMSRNVGLLMTTDAVLDHKNNPIGEGILDAVVTTLCAMHDRKLRHNSRTGAIYIVKPKLHGAEEVAFAVKIFAGVENMLGLPQNTIKVGLMDEERRTSANLKAAIMEARQRIFFINTGFLDRTGDEIHTAMKAGVVLPKEDIKAEKWLAAYEDRNVILGLQCGFAGKAQIGKGMWAKPDCMSEMLKNKGEQMRAGANCAWVPSPTAATLHALHYHEVDVDEAQIKRADEAVPSLQELFSMPVVKSESISTDAVRAELDNNAQGILGYVVRWVDQGVGCSKVPDIHNTALMEDRATCRISSQVIANWLEHGVVNEEEVLASFRRMAAVVDRQNADDARYRPMTPDTAASEAFHAALSLALEGMRQPSGYTEPILHAARRQVKHETEELRILQS